MCLGILDISSKVFNLFSDRLSLVINGSSMHLGIFNISEIVFILTSCFGYPG